MNADNGWKESYQAAVLESDREKLPDRVHAAKAAIDARLHEIQLDHGGTPEERQALSDALACLNMIRREIERRAHETGPTNT